MKRDECFCWRCGGEGYLGCPVGTPEGDCHGRRYRCSNCGGSGTTAAEPPRPQVRHRITERESAYNKAITAAVWRRREEKGK